MNWNVTNYLPEFTFWFESDLGMYYKYRVNDFLYFVVEYSKKNKTYDMIIPKLDENEFKECAIDNDDYDSICVCANINNTPIETIRNQMVNYKK